MLDANDTLETLELITFSFDTDFYEVLNNYTA